MKPADKDDKNLFSKKIAQQEKRKLDALNEKDGGIWFGLGMFGMVGWSVAVPTLMGLGLGIWLDKKYPVSISWTLTFLMFGLIAGCLMAWHWITEEEDNIHPDKD